MGRWLGRRVAAAAAIVFAVLTFAFAAVHLAPGSPFMPRGDRPALDAATVSRLERQFGLDRPLPVQFVRYIHSVARGNFGQSFSQRRPVADVVADAVPHTLVLGAVALLIDLVLGITIGVVQARRAGRRLDTWLTNLTLLAYSLPAFWLGLVLLMVFGAWLQWLPVGGVVDPVMHESLGPAGRLVDRLRHLALPAVTLGLVGAAGTARYQRSATIDALARDHIRTARAKGLSAWRVTRGHVLRTALLPAITLLGLSFPLLLTGTVVIESVFVWPGMGKLATDAIAARDYPVVLATTVIAAVMVVAGSLLADALYALCDPRARSDLAT